MRRATRTLISWICDKSVFYVSVQPLRFDAAEPNQCFENVMKYLDANTDWYMHSGWLVGEFLGERGTAIMPHYWVVNPIGTHFDVTPRNSTDTQKYEYVSDFNIAKFVSKQEQIPVPIKLASGGEFLALRNDGTFETINKLNYEYLFALAKQ